MKLSQREATQLHNILSTCSLAGIEEIVFQNKDIGVASGIKQGSCAIIIRNDVPALPQKMGISRISILKKRLDLLMGLALSIEAKESDRGEIVQLEMVSGKAKTQYRCTSASMLKAPAELGDGGFTGLITINKEELALIINATKAMTAEAIILVVKKDGTTSFETTDSNDRFTIELNKSIERVGDEESDSSVFYYEPNIFSGLLRAAIGTSDSITITVGSSGTIQFELNKCELSIFAQIDGGND